MEGIDKKIQATKDRIEELQIYADERESDRKKQLEARRKYIDIIEQKERDLEEETNLSDRELD